MELLTNKQYHSNTDYVSKSGLDKIHKAPKLYHAHYLDKNKPKEPFNEAFLTGSAFHTFVLEPELLAKEYVVMPDYKGTGSKYKKESFKAQHKDKSCISYKTYMQINGMTESVLNHPIASKLLKGGVAEQTFTWVDSDTGVKCKCRPDKWNQERKFILDLKSTIDASDRGFKNSAIKFRYDVQASFYMDGLLENGFDIERFYFIAVEKTYPYLVNVFFADSNTLRVGREKYKEDLKTYAECLFNDEWQGYEPMIKALGIEY